MSEPQEQTTPFFTIVDLTEVRDALGDHYNHNWRDEYVSGCACGEDVTQDQDTCSFCGRSIIWRNSRLWKQLYGNPEDAIRHLAVVPPSDEAGKQLCRLAGVTGFANKTQAKRWSKAVKKIGQDRARAAVDFVQHRRSMAKSEFLRRRGAAMIAHALNLVEKIAREEPESQPESTEDYASRKGITLIQ